MQACSHVPINSVMGVPMCSEPASFTSAELIKNIYRFILKHVRMFEKWLINKATKMCGESGLMMHTNTVHVKANATLHFKVPMQSLTISLKCIGDHQVTHTSFHIKNISSCLKISCATRPAPHLV